MIEVLEEDPTQAPSDVHTAQIIRLSNRRPQETIKTKMKIFHFLSRLADRRHVEIDFIEKIKLSIFAVFMLIAMPLAILVWFFE